MRLTVAQNPGEAVSEELAALGARFSATELALPEELEKQDWARIGRKLCRLDQIVKWWLGDWAAYGIRRYGELKEFAEINGINYQTLMDLGWVAGSIEVSRRRENVEFSKHREVAALAPAEQDRWLEKAESEKLPVSDLRRQLRQAGGKFNALEADGPVLKFASKACDDLVNWLRQRPEEFWDEERRSAWRKRLEPIVHFYEGL